MPSLAQRVANGVALANIPTLLMVLVQLSGERRWLEPPYQVQRGYGVDDNDHGGLTDELQQQVRDAASAAIVQWLQTGEMAIARPDDALAARMMAASMGQAVPDEYGPMVADDLARVVHAPAPGKVRNSSGTAVPDGFHVLVIGAGAGGICAAVRLRAAGIPFTLVERADSVGGVWQANHYPGVGVDTPNHLYSYTFAPYDFSRYFVLGAELCAYLKDVVQRFELETDMRLSSTVRTARFDERKQHWQVDIDGPEGSYTLQANVVIAGSGLFNPPKLPDIAGLDRFAGTCVHTAQWPADLDLSGKHVAIIGSGASAMQTVPAIADQVSRLTIFQRSATWAAPFDKFKVPVPPELRWLFDKVPLYRAWYRQRLNWLWSDRLLDTLRRDPDWPHPERSMNARNDRLRQAFTRYIESEVGDHPDRDALLAKLVPSYPPYGKRILFDNGWFRTAARAHVHLVDDPIKQIEADGVRTQSGELHTPDVLILATGFDVQRFLSTFEIIGRGGVNIRDVWGEDEARAYLGTAIPGFPNFFCLYGPNSQSGAGGSIIAVIEYQMNYAMSAITQMFEQGIGTIECKQTVHDDYNRALDANLKDLVWAHPGVSTYYQNSKGRVTVNSGMRKVDFWHMTRAANLDEYELEPACADKPV